MKTNLKMFDDKGQIADFDGLRLAAGNRPGAWGLTAADGAGRVRLRWELDDDRVVVNGSVSVYERDGKYQLYAKEITLEGAGLLF